MTNLTELADRVEALTGPCRKVDLAIVAIVKAGMRSPWFIAPPSFTGSLDAAMALVPEGWAVEQLSMWPAHPDGDELSQSRCNLLQLQFGSWRNGQRPYSYGGSTQVKSRATTPALALCAAALRAREPLAP